MLTALKNSLIDKLIDTYSCQKNMCWAKMNIPSQLGFGTVGVPGLVPPNTNLIYDVEKNVKI